MREFVLGVGAQKAGTTWLYEQMEKAPQFRTGPCKEYHIFDALYVPECAAFRAQVLARLTAALAEGEIINPTGQWLLRYNMLTRPNSYFNFFDKLLDAEGTLSADVTPSYSGLPVKAFARIKAGFAKRGIRVKVVLLMREPVTRLESAIRMGMRKQDKLSDLTPALGLQRLRKTARDPQENLRSNYPATVRALREVFDPSDLHFGFFETMFEPREMDRLATFLGLPVEILDKKQKVNSSPVPVCYDARDLTEIADRYADVYSFVRDDLGFDTTLWEQARARLHA